MNFVEELRWRGMLHDIMPKTEEELNKGITSGYIGFDPTADSLHVGHLTQIMTLTHFQRAGHKPFALVGGATGMIGDPSFKSQERNLLDEQTLNHNVERIKAQLASFLDFNSGANSAEMVNNYDWFKNFSFLDFIRDVGKHITVNYMMAKDSVKKRLEGDSGLSFTEFTYQLLQGYDFYHLWKNENCILQMGGSDQWGNIVTGTEMIRRMGGGSAFALTTQLIKKADGTKFGKTESGAVWLDPVRTSPYQFYQFWLNSTDADAKSYIRIFTLLDRETIEALDTEHDAAPHLRVLQKALAKDITIRVHGEAAYEKAIKSSDFLFGNVGIEFLNELTDAEVKGIFEGVPNFNVSVTELREGINATELLAGKTAVFPSKGEAKKMIQGGGVAVNKNKIATPEDIFNAENLINGKYLVAQKGKKNYFLIIAE
ncbi:tyrosine--tRNA ligase [Mucilaginibacter roseus]|uniref:Tyrosine--tRNA ligase n=1 Tax=Mucilaginibacter roseus TaxID=1528868 RepID=A0ABS8U415_9SPHI|nr:tyrosine--tRNA ligase [Mucilaginibacter roseus]MCD8740311.1 tyrosine--tRNA ligase [Mucilaginibacter roseus]